MKLVAGVNSFATTYARVFALSLDGLSRGSNSPLLSTLPITAESQQSKVFTIKAYLIRRRNRRYI